MKIESINNIPKSLPLSQQSDNQPQREQVSSTPRDQRMLKISKPEITINRDKGEELINQHKAEIINNLNNIMSMVDKRLEFTIHEATNRTSYKIINRETNEVLKEFPPEKILDLVAKMMEMAGIFVDEKV